jgi:YD repeat-containing protein
VTIYQAPPEQARNTVTVLDGANNILEKTTHYFSAFPQNVTLGAFTTFARPEDYGLPFTRQPLLAQAGRFLSSQVFPCTGGSCSDQPARSTYLTYAGGIPAQWSVSLSADGALANARVEGERTVFADSGCGGSCYTDTAHSNFDDYGHYRQTVATSNFPGAGERTSYTNHLPDPARWLFTKYAESWVKQVIGSEVSGTKTITEFDAEKGAVKSVRTLRSTGPEPSARQPAANDLLSVMCRNVQVTAGARGFVTGERFFGGDVQPIPSGDPCAAPRVDGQYVLDHTYSFSGGALSAHTAQYSGTSHLVANETFDANTGLIGTSRDSAGVATNYSYDGSGRVSSVRTAGVAGITYDYATTSTPSSVTVRTCKASEATCVSAPLAEARYFYDSLGRLDQERRAMPDGQWSATWTEYDALGRKKFTSVPVGVSNGSPGFTPAYTAGTSWEYDALGRVTRETMPDQAYSSNVYAGVREITRFAGRQSPVVAAVERSKEVFDDAGRLLRVEQTTQQNGKVTASYRYDAGGRLTSVNMSDPSGALQPRTFDYDGAGLLRSESHPEAGLTSYTYDARGHVATKAQGGAQSLFNLRYAYDAAERLTEVRTGDGAGGDRPGKLFVFGSAEGSSRGKLISATRYNYLTPDLYEVRETFAYDDPAGRLTGTTTEIKRNGSVVQNLTRSQAYDDAGNIGTVGYPVCASTVLCGSAAWNAVTATFKNGFLTAVPGFADSISYTAAGAVSVVDHSGPMTDTYTADVTGVRPESIRFDGQSSCAQPLIASGSPQDQVVASSQTATLSVSATGATAYQWYRAGVAIAGATASSYVTPPLTATTTYAAIVSNACGSVTSRSATVSVTATAATTYQWYRDGVAITGATASSYVTPALTASTTYAVIVSNACSSATSRTAIVSVGQSCPAPAITVQPADQSVAAGQSATLSVTATAAGAYQWYGDTGLIAGATASSYVTPALTATATYSVIVTNACGSVTSRTAVVSVACPKPAITAQPVDQSVVSGQTATLTVTATGATSYQWIDANGTIPGKTASTFTTPPLTATAIYQVRAINSCGSVVSRVVTVEVCSTPPSIASNTPQDQTIASGQTATLTVTASGAQTYQWYEGAAPISGQTAASFTTPVLTASRAYSVRVSNGCTPVTSRTATITVVNLATPTGLNAVANGTSSITVSWSASSGAHHYILERKSNGSAFTALQAVTGTSFLDSGVVANRTYVYRVRAVSSDETASSTPSNMDMATTMVFSPLAAGATPVTAAQFEELLAAVNAIRAASGALPATWSAILPAGVPAPAPGVPIRADHILSLRAAMNSARGGLGFPSLNYTDPVLTGVPIRIVHQIELRGGVQ